MGVSKVERVPTVTFLANPAETLLFKMPFTTSATFFLPAETGSQQLIK